jgi:hypothetical protein
MCGIGQETSAKLRPEAQIVYSIADITIACTDNREVNGENQGFYAKAFGTSEELIDDVTIANELQRIFSRPSLRVYTNDDVVGCEVAGVVKNVIAIAAGMAEGMGFGDNTRATLITRGLAEMTRLGVAMGGHPVTFAGLAGMGDLIATCSSKQSRNNQVGLQLGQGRTIEEILAAAPELVLLPDEPYVFESKHADELKAAGLASHFLLVDGKDLAWYGPRIPQGLARLSAAVRAAA